MTITRSALGFLFFICSLAAFGQSRTLQIDVLDDRTGETLPGATIKAVLAADTTIFTGKLTDTNGHASLPLSRLGTYTLSVDYLGYETARTTINIQTLSGEEILKPFALKPSELALAEINIEERADRVALKGDTTELNANAYR